MADKTKVVSLTGSATVTWEEVMTEITDKKTPSWQLATYTLLAERGLPVGEDGWPDPRYMMMVNQFYSEDGEEVYEYRWRRAPAA
jgi:hypothetical protein